MFLWASKDLETSGHRITSIFRAFESLELHDVMTEQKVSDMQR